MWPDAKLCSHRPRCCFYFFFCSLKLSAHKTDVCSRWMSQHLGIIIIIFHETGRSRPASASCCRWQTRLGFLSVPGILRSQSFLEFWKGLWASHPESPSIKTHKAAGLFSLFWALFPVGCLPSNSIQMCRIQKHVCLNEIHPSTRTDQGPCFS